MRAIQHSDQGKPNRVRVLVRGKPGAFQRGQLLPFQTEIIEITKHNVVDIEAFIVEELKSAFLFQGADKDSRRRKRMVEERLLARCNNCYLTIQQDIRRVKDIFVSGGTTEELNRALHESNSDPQELVLSNNRTLEALLKPPEIEGINELLIWTVAANGYMYLLYHFYSGLPYYSRSRESYYLSLRT